MSVVAAIEGRAHLLIIAATALLLLAAAPTFLSYSCPAHGGIHLKGPARVEPYEERLNPEQYAITARQEQRAFCTQPRGQDFPQTRMIELPNKVKMHVHTGSDIVSDSIASSNNYWESYGVQATLQVMSLAIPGDAPKPLMVDIGANVGAYTLNIAKAGYPVVAFEGLRANVQMMRASICDTEGIEQHITLHSMGLGDTPTECVIMSDTRNVGDGHACCGRVAIERAIKAGYAIRGSMQIEALDNVIRSDIRVMKVDVEGFEAHVIRGGHKLFNEHTVWFIQMEYNSDGMAPEQTTSKSPKPAYQHILDLHRAGYRISKNGYKGPYMTEADFPKLIGLFDLFMVHPKFQDGWWGTSPTL